MRTKDPGSDILGREFPGTHARGISVPAFLRNFQDTKACLDHLFWLRGGHAVKCRRCGKPTIWKRTGETPKFRSQCCFTTLSATRGTIFHRSSMPLWLWFYALVLIMGLSASPSSGFLARHLDLTRSGAWKILRKIRQQFSLVCERGSESLRGKTVVVDNLLLNNALSPKGHRTSAANVLIVATEDTAFAFAVPRRHPAYYREILDRLQVNSEIYASDYDKRFVRIGSKLKNYHLNLLTTEQAGPPDAWAKFRHARLLGAYLRASIAKRHPKLNKATLGSYLSEFVFRFNFAQDKAMLFPLFMTSLERIAYCDENEAREQIGRFGRNLPRSLPG